jgi:hypothetical protein
VNASDDVRAIGLAVFGVEGSGFAAALHDEAGLCVDEHAHFLPPVFLASDFLASLAAVTTFFAASAIEVALITAS